MHGLALHHAQPSATVFAEPSYALQIATWLTDERYPEMNHQKSKGKTGDATSKIRDSRQ
jgi:hypothetical protein